MLRSLVYLLVVIWCLKCSSAKPAGRRFSYYRAPRLPSRPILDQIAEESSLVDDFVPHHGNTLASGTAPYSKPQYPGLYSLPEENQPRDYNKKCPGCEPMERVVTLGESRSYSVVTNSRQGEPILQKKSLLETTTQWTTSEAAETTTEITTTEEGPATDDKIISVRVSSSVGYPEPAALQTVESPYATAVQRSQLNVEEAVHEPITPSQGQSTENNKRQVVDDDGRKTDTSQLAGGDSQVETATPKSFVPTATSYQFYPTLHSRTDRRFFLGNPKSNERLSVGMTDPRSFVAVENSSPPVNPLTSPVSYRTSLKSATSGSSVSFYREPPNFQRTTSTEPTTTPPPVLPERQTHETRVETVSFHEEVVVPEKPSEKIENLTKENEGKSYQFTNIDNQNFHHVQVSHLEKPGKIAASYKPKQDYSQPEKVYGMPEQNYEVDEALSLKTNGRAHGVQGYQTNQQDSNKFGYVVEGRNFKKYRVEEKTSDGFIVGEYGVVRHDDGSLRGVRYTADSTINPKVIYEALVKFLSL